MTGTPDCALFSPLTLRGVTMRNRIMISPMQQYMAEADGLPNAFHVQHYGRQAIGGAGTVMTEALAVSPEGRVTWHDLGLWNDAQQDALRPIVAMIRRAAPCATQRSMPAAKAASGAPGKATIRSPPRMPHAARHHGRRWRRCLAGQSGWHEPEAMDEDRIAHDRCLSQRGASGRAGGIPLSRNPRCAWLSDPLLPSPIANRRDDRWGGDLGGRKRFLLAVTEAVRAAWPSGPAAVGAAVLRRPARRLDHRGQHPHRGRLEGARCGPGRLFLGRSWERTTTDDPPPGRLQVPFAERIRREAGMPTIAVA